MAIANNLNFISCFFVSLLYNAFIQPMIAIHFIQRINPDYQRRRPPPPPPPKERVPPPMPPPLRNEPPPEERELLTELPLPKERVDVLGRLPDTELLREGVRFVLRSL